jgi:hypothetical protein
VNGPYTVTWIGLVDANGTLADQQNLAHVTQAYTYATFSQPLVSLTGDYQNYGEGYR